MNGKNSKVVVAFVSMCLLTACSQQKVQSPVLEYLKPGTDWVSIKVDPIPSSRNTAGPFWHAVEGNLVISRYDKIFKKYASELKWDWRLLAALVYNESNFRPDAKSCVGAYGLMQMMPSTMEQFGIDTSASAESHIRAGVLYLKYLDKMLSFYVPDADERVKFVLAAYNIGPGHVLDARRLAFKYGRIPNRWDGNVALCLLNKRSEEPEVRHGSCKGRQTNAFVRNVMLRFQHYIDMTPEVMVTSDPDILPTPAPNIEELLQYPFC